MKKNNDINERSEEVYDILERMPTGWTGMVTIVISFIMTVLTVLSFLIKYPDTVSGQITLTTTNAPVRMVAMSTGRLHLLHKDKEMVSKGCVVAYIENGARIEDVRTLEKICNNSVSIDYHVSLKRGLTLGELSSSYNNFVLAYEQFDMLRHSMLYKNMRKSLREKIRTDSSLMVNIAHEMNIKHHILENVGDRLGKDSLLKDRGALSEEDFTSKKNAYLSQKEAIISIKSSELSKLSEIKQNKVAIAKTDIEESEKIRNAFINVLASHNKLANELRQWKERYLFVTTIYGRLEYLGFWRENTFVTQNEEMFSVLPVHDSIHGELFVPINGAGKIERGQSVNVRLNDFPYNEYGMIKGKVVKISETSNRINTTNGQVEAYRVWIDFPDGSMTNYGKNLRLKYEAKGYADIITKPKRLIERLFDNLKAQENK